MASPFFLLGDGWQNPTGLARIARDLHAALGGHYLGFHPPGQVVSNDDPTRHSWSHLGDDWGASHVVPWIAQRAGPQSTGTLLVVWDPSRAAHYLAPFRQLLPHWRIWGYFAVDGHDHEGKIGGDAGMAIRNFDRVTAYTRYGLKILREVRGAKVSAVPHGHWIDGPTSGLAGADIFPRFRADRGDWILGCVATNQPRKDLGLFVTALASLRQRGERVWGWLHTDLLQRSGCWAIPQLIARYHMEPWIRVTTGTLGEAQIRQYYSACAATICVGRGEGFGYPIIESLACDRPVVALDYAGGAELVPPAWRYTWRAVDATNELGIQRPIGDLEDVVARLQTLREHPPVVGYCKGSVAHLHWNYLLPRWQSWLHAGLEE